MQWMCTYDLHDCSCASTAALGQSIARHGHRRCVVPDGLTTNATYCVVAAVEEVALGQGAAAAADSGAWVPVCLPEELPKGEHQLGASAHKRIGCMGQPSALTIAIKTTAHTTC